MKYVVSVIMVLVLCSVGYASSPYTNLSHEGASSIYDEAVISDWLSKNVGFEENLGQVADMEGKPVPEVLYRANFPGYSLFVTEKGLSVVIYKREKDENLQEEIGRRPYERLRRSKSDEMIRYARFDIIPVNGTISREKIVVEEPVPGVSNYYLAHCPDGILGVHSYSVLRIQDVYPGIDWVLRVGEKVHHEFVVEPGADWRQIKLKVKWADVEVLDGGRKVKFHTRVGEIVDGAVVAWEDKGDKSVPVEVTWREKGKKLLGFEVKGYSGEGRLVIDPPLELGWATYYGGAGNEVSDFNEYTIVVGPNGNVFLTGYTYSSDFPTYDPGGGVYYDGTFNDSCDVFILKFTNAGVREWATYYGGSDRDKGRSIAVGPNGSVFVTGTTQSADFPTYDPGSGAYYDGTFSGGCDAFILKFTNGGVREWATYYGGSDNDFGFSIAVGPNGNVFVTGFTRSADFPTYDPGSGAYYDGTFNGGDVDAFILKFTSEGMREWATYYGGSGWEWSNSIAVGPNGNVFVTGYTCSSNFPTYDPGGGAFYDGTWNGDCDVLILKFTNEGMREWATYYGGSGDDEGNSIAVGPNGNLFVTGFTRSRDFPTYNPGGGAYYDGTWNGGSDVFILKFNEADLTSVGEGTGDGIYLAIKVPTLFNDRMEVRISGAIGSGSIVELRIYDVAGRMVLGRRVPLTAGTGDQVVFIGGESIRMLPAGVYLLKVSVDGRFSGVYPTIKLK